MSLPLKIIDRLTDIPAAQWDRLAGDHVFTSHVFLSALQQSGCAVADTGWQAQYLTAWDGDRLAGAMPLYLKSHSWGEFVFDMTWADAYRRHGLRYYPKLVCSVPFTPVAGRRVLADNDTIATQLLQAAIAMARDTGISSLHILFPDDTQKHCLQQQGLMIREGVQFHWRNPGYRDFDDFLATLRRSKRKNILQERRKVREAGITLQRLVGSDIREADWHDYLRCYESTHRQYASPMALNLAFFLQVQQQMGERILLVLARQGQRTIAGALNFHDGTALYGRSWGSLDYIDGLHFEACYYQGMEFCIERGLPLFEGGAQGEHKHARGFLPTRTWSAHWLAHPEFAAAVDHFLSRETAAVEGYINELDDSNPFRAS